MHPLFYLLFLASFVVSTLQSISGAFDPRAYPQKLAECDAINRAKDKRMKIDIHYVDINPSARTSLVLVHGWPSLWSSWSNQILEFQNEYRIIAPDNRGFGSSTHPGDVQSSGTMPDIAADLVCVLHHAGVQNAICIGHDWGAQVCWEAARQRPDIFNAVSGIVVPYMPSVGNFVPISNFVTLLPRLAYQIYFQDHTEEAIAELNKDIRRTIRATLRDVASPPPPHFLTSNSSYLGAYNNIPVIPPVPFFTPDEEDYFVEQYSVQGFNYNLEFYTFKNRYLSWKAAHDEGNATITQPALSILPTEDPVADWVEAARLLGSEQFIPNLKTVLVAAAHWPQLEQPKQVNDALRNWLKTLPGVVEAKSSSHDHISDEL